MSTTRSEYGGPRRKLVLAFDVGTTYSGISYSILDPGAVPEIRGVTRFPAHEEIGGAAKIPTIIYYDRAGKVKAVGAEAMRQGIDEVAEEKHWVKAEWFKLHLRSRVGTGRDLANDIPPLPLKKTVVEVFADFLAYLLKCASNYIQDAHANGAALWASVKDEIDFVLSHPNGWEGPQQGEMRKAALLAKLIPNTTAGHARLFFVTEGEASLHYSVQNGLPIGVLRDGDGVVIVDAGGGTIDISSYSKKVGEAKYAFEEVAAPQCHFNGSVFVTVRARLFLKRYLQESTFLGDLAHIVGCFEKTTKLRFRNSNEPQYIKFGGVRDNDPTFNIRIGQLKLLGSDVATFFEPAVECIVKAVLDQRKVAHKPISHVVLVGGFAASDWLYNEICEKLLSHGLNIIRPLNHVNKAVSDGALSFYHDHFVRSRVSRITYGTFCNPIFDPAAPDHQQRLSKVYTSVSGNRRIPDFFSIILPKNTQVSETTEFRKSYRREYKWKSAFNIQANMRLMPVSVWCYRGAVAEPKWKDVDTQNYTPLCTIEFDASNIPLSHYPKVSGSGEYYFIKYDVVLLFGLTELKAQVAWKENGVEQRSAAKIVYDPSDVRQGPSRYISKGARSLFSPFMVLGQTKKP